MITYPYVAIGQLHRRLTHVRRFYQALEEPAEYQERRLLRIIHQNENTVFGRRHSFEQIRSVSDFQDLVPPAEYEDLRPYIESLRNGDRNQLTSEEPFMFATTSGTTADPKFIPVTETHLQDYAHAFQIHNYHLIKDYPRAARGKCLVIVSNDEEGRTAGDLPFGAISGLLNKRQPAIIRRHFAAPYELCKVKDVDTKYYLMLRMALAQDVTAILCCNPSSLLLLAEQLSQQASDLVSDIHDGTVKRSFRPPVAIAHAFTPFLRPDQAKARYLEKILQQSGSLRPCQAWQNLAVLSCWKGGPMSFYLEKLGEPYGQTAIRDFGYMASEGRGSIPIGNDGAGGVLAVTSHFFEFVPEHEIDRRNKSFLLAHELELNRRYYIFFTTAAGLYRYNINDLIEVVGFAQNTPLISFVRKGLGISSVTGEKVTEEQVLNALTQATRQLNLVEFNHFSAEVALSMPPHYVCFAELAANITEAVKNEFIRLFDHSLKMQNPEYRDKRDGKRLGGPVLKILPAGTYARLRQQRVTAGAPEAQVKIPLLGSPNSIAEKLACLGV